MAISPNTRLGRYEIRSQLGAGGMGEVYLARDPKINRDVAIKVLPAAFSSDSERLRRFELEVQATGKLNHPNILAVYDVETHDGAPYVVYELLEGETLRERLSDGLLPARKAIDYALQIARGLAAAHGKGIVHRDLKPDNVFITHDDQVKILDFGLAKLIERTDESEAQTDVPTRRVNTDPGVVMGTVGYMSPEQVRGRPADHRSDIFSLGVILYEMLSGKRAFHGDSAVETLNAILKEDPPELSATTNRNVAPALERVVWHCIEKSPERRFQSATDVAFALEALSGLTSQTSEQTLAPLAPAPARLKKREMLAWALVAMATIAALSVAALYFRRAPAETPATATRFFIYPPEKTAFTGAFAVSPDGRRVVFRVISEGKALLWVRALDSLAAQPLAGTEEANFPFWSPDSRFVGFSAGGKLKKIEVTGGPAQTLCDAPDSREGAWNRDGVIVVTLSPLSTLYRVSAAGGAPTSLTMLDASRKETFHAHPRFLPDGRHFLYYANSGQSENRGIFVGSLDSKETKRLISTDAHAAYSPPGYLLFLRERTLMAQGFDADRLELTGEPFPVAEQVDRFTGAHLGLFSVSETGVLVYRSGTAENVQLAWFDRGGKQLGTVGPPGAYFNPWLSPDEKRVAVTRDDPQVGTADIWLMELARGTPTRFTFGPSVNITPIWSPDGSRIVFSTNRDGPMTLYQRAASGAGNDEALLKSDHPKAPNDWSADGRFILYQDRDPKTNRDLWVLPLSGDQEPFPFLQTEFDEFQGQFSPDGKWIAYTSNESGTWQAYVRSFPAAGGKWQVSTAGGAQPQWRRDGRELFYLSPDRKLMSVEVKGDGSSFEVGVPKVLFELRVPGIPGPRNYYVAAADSQRFLVTSLLEEATPADHRRPELDSRFEAMTLDAGTKLGRYEIVSQLGAGGMGEVYLAEDTRLHRKVALKILPAELASNQDRMRRFVQEAEAAAALNHPHIAHIYEIGSSPGSSPTVKEGLAHGSTTENLVHFIAMEFIDGDTLREKIYRDKTPLPKLLGYLNQVAEGLNKAHASGIVHRDLKPDNIMITHDGYAKILDFGLAKLIEARKTFETGDTGSSEIATAVMRQQSIPGMVMGTVGYMSPEQAQGKVKEIDHRSDIFSFGCILFEAATGQKAFEGKDVLDSLHKIVHAPTPQIKDFNLTAPVDLQRIVRRCLAKDPEDRYQTIKEVVIELKELRREMENAAEVELSVAAETTADPHVSKTGDRTISGGDKTAASTAELVAHSTSSAEYVVGEVKKHKLGAMIVVALLAVVLAGVGYGIYRLTTKRNKPALSFQSAKFTRLTTTGKASGVAISPDGKYVVHIQDDGGQQSLWMRQTATQSNVQIMPPADNVKYSRLMFSPDGDYLFYVARENNAAPALYQIPALGGSPRKLSPNVGNFMALSPDGARVASIRRAPDEGKDVLVVSNVDGSGERRLVERRIPERMLYAGGRGSAPAWSPEGHRIAFASYEYGIVYANVVVAQVDNGVEETLSSEKWYNMKQLAWLSDGSGVVMLASDQRGYPPQLWHLSHPEGSARRITNDLNSYTTVSVTADSRSLVTVQTETLSTIWVAPERDSNGARQISFGTAKIDEGPVWTPDGRIVYESRTGDSINIWIMDADGGNQKQLTFDNGRTPDVSPDGRYIVFRSNRSITPHIYRMEMDGSNLKQVTDGTGEFGPRMTPDGKWVYFSSRSSGNLTVWRAPIDGGKITQIIDHPSYGADFSPDGKWLGCIYWSGQEDAPRTVAIIPFEGGQPVKLFDLPGANPFARWAPDGRALIYVDTRGDVSNLWTRAIDGGTLKQLTDFKQGRIFSFDYSPDGKQIALSRGTINNDVVMISNFK